ncbi:PHD finger protein 21B [Trichechus manatus latirostris]|uniref:PHD finger protein 21B n=1 Tax=Trichechus manatus latirostris TaxID=127582 RepID=A0A2Y9R6Z9_TRIMA|nr:PHD finger protein 21B [Trichechus manatus latirostris]
MCDPGEPLPERLLNRTLELGPGTLVVLAPPHPSGNITMLLPSGDLVGPGAEGGVRPELSSQEPTALGTTTAVPVTGPQVSSLQRLAGQGAAVLPQVRPKTLIPDSLPVTPGRDRPPKQPPAFQKATVVSIKNPSPALPTANNTVSHVPAGSSQPQARAEPTAVASPLSSAGVAYTILSTSSNATAITPSTAVSVVSDSIKVQPLLISADNKLEATRTEWVISEGPKSPGAALGHGCLAQDKAAGGREALGQEGGHEIQSKRQERKRRSTANPAYSGLLETEALKKDEGVPWTGMLAIVHSYVTHKTVKEEEKQKLLQRGSRLQSEHQQLEERDRRLASAVKKCLELKTSLLAQQRGTQSSLERLRALLRLIQGEQMLQVTMTTTSPAPLLAGPWTKPSAAAMHSALQHTQEHN